jgi:hypothetical protein
MVPAAVAANAPGERIAAALPPNGARIRVYILDGFDPLGLANTGQLAEQLQQAGFYHVTVGGWYSGGTFEREIRELHSSDPGVRFGVIGFSAGSYAVRALANRLVESGIPVSVVGYIGGDYLADTPETRVPGVGHVVNVTGDGYLLTGRNLFFNGIDVSGATNVRLAGTWHSWLPAHPDTLAALTAALAADDGD